MRSRFAAVLAGLALIPLPGALAQSGSLSLPAQVEAGSAFSVQSTGSGKPPYI